MDLVERTGFASGVIANIDSEWVMVGPIAGDWRFLLESDVGEAGRLLPVRLPPAAAVTLVDIPLRRVWWWLGWVLVMFEDEEDGPGIIVVDPSAPNQGLVNGLTSKSISVPAATGDRNAIWAGADVHPRSCMYEEEEEALYTALMVGVGR